MDSFAATERHGHTEDHVLAQIDGNAAPIALAHVREIQIAFAQGDFAGIVSKHQAQMAADGANDSVLAGRTLFAQFAIVFRSNGHEVGTAEAVVPESGQGLLTIDIRTADSLLKIKRDRISCAGIRDGIPPQNGEIILPNYATVLPLLRIETVFGCGLQAAEGIVARVGVLIEVVIDFVIEREALEKVGVRTEKDLFVDQRRLIS